MEEREIKFRAWNEELKYMAYQGTPDLETIKSFMFHFASEVLMQYTGVKDKNGKEIYENDVVLVDENIGLVVFCSGCFMIEWMDEKESYREFLFFGRNCNYAREGKEQVEVIGNIFEN